MSSSGLKIQNFKTMNKLDNIPELEASTDTAIAYSTCYVPFLFTNLI